MTYKQNEQVDLIIAERSQLGYKAIVNGEHWGIFPSDIIGKLFIGKSLKKATSKIFVKKTVRLTCLKSRCCEDE